MVAFIEGTARGTYVFVDLDNFVKKAPKDANGTALIDVVFGWTRGCIDFVTAVVNHYNGTTAPHVAFYELWNEMSNNLFYTGSVAQMDGLARAAYPS